MYIKLTTQIQYCKFNFNRSDSSTLAGHKNINMYGQNKSLYSLSEGRNASSTEGTSKEAISTTNNVTGLQDSQIQIR